MPAPAVRYLSPLSFQARARRKQREPWAMRTARMRNMRHPGVSDLLTAFLDGRSWERAMRPWRMWVRLEHLRRQLREG